MNKKYKAGTHSSLRRACAKKSSSQRDCEEENRIVSVIKAEFQKLNRRIDKMTRTIDELVESAESETTLVESVAALLATLKSQIDAAVGGDLSEENKAKIEKIFDLNEANKKKLADAIVANTPAA